PLPRRSPTSPLFPYTTLFRSLPATFAAVLKNRVKQVTLKQGLTAYAEIAESEDYNWPLSALPPAILARFDLPDCYREIAKTKKLDRKSTRLNSSHVSISYAVF